MEAATPPASLAFKEAPAAAVGPESPASVGCNNAQAGLLYQLISSGSRVHPVYKFVYPVYIFFE